MRNVARHRLRPVAVALLLLGAGTAALAGMPDGSRVPADAGVLSGTVRDSAGAAVADAPVALFDAAGDALIEITHTDRGGRYAFQQDPGPHHVLAAAPAGSGLVDAWALDRDGSERSLALTLPTGRPVHVRVTGADGRALEHAEVRVYALDGRSDEPRVVADARADAGGSATCLAPEHVHLAVFGPDLRYLPRWRFDLDVPPAGLDLAISLPDARPMRGTVVDTLGRPLAGILVSAWELEDTGPQWDGYQLTREGGTFLFYGSRDHTLLRAIDREQLRLPTERRVGAAAEPVLVLAEGEPSEIRCVDATQDPTPARVWVWSETAGAWSWGTRTDSRGVLQAQVDSSHALIAEPLSADARPAMAFDQTWQAGPVQVRFPRAGPLPKPRRPAR